MLSLSEDTQSDVIEAFNSTSRYLNDLLIIDNNFFDSMVNRIYPSELQLNVKCQVIFKNIHFCCIDKRYKRIIVLQTMIKTPVHSKVLSIYLMQSHFTVYEYELLPLLFKRFSTTSQTFL